METTNFLNIYLNFKQSKNSIIQQSFIVRLLITVAFYASVIQYPRLWISDFSFPLIPVFKFIQPPNYIISIIILGIHILLLLYYLFFPKKTIWFLILILFIYSFLTDINRLQPSNYILFLLFFSTQTKQNSLSLITIILAGVYFWSGIHKCNLIFFDVLLNGLEKKLHFIPIFIKKIIVFSIPFLEASFGLLLLFKRTYKTGSLFLITMHLIILGMFFFLSTGKSVLIINLLLIGILCLLFMNNSKEKIFNKMSIQKIILIFIVGLMPMFNFIGRWDHFLSFSIFSGKPKYAYIQINDKLVIDKLPKSVKPYISHNKKSINIIQWAYENKGILIYPETRVYNDIYDYLKNYTPENKNSLTLVEF